MSSVGQVFVDLDGPLLDGKERHYFCYRTILEGFGFKPLGIEQYWERKKARQSRRHLLEASSAEAIYDEFIAAWLTAIESPDALALDKLQSGAIDCLRDWSAQGIELTLVTMRRNRVALEEQLKRLKLRPFFDSVIVCDHSEGGAGKAQAVRKTRPTIGKDAVWIGDTEVDWEAAKSLGCQAMLVANGLRNEEVLRTLEGARVRRSIISLKDEIRR